MIHTLPAPIRGAPALRITEGRKIPGHAVVVTGQLGEGSTDEDFVADPLLQPIERAITGEEYVAFTQHVEAAGAPLGEYRDSDVIAWLDEHGWTR